MKCITLHQPWATWIAEGWKRIETRTHDKFKSLEGQRIGIHAGLKTDNEAFRMVQSIGMCTQDWYREACCAAYVTGAIICTAKVVAVNWLGPQAAPLALIECETRRFGLYLRDIKKLAEPIPAKGKQGIWEHEIPDGFDNGFPLT